MTLFDLSFDTLGLVLEFAGGLRAMTLLDSSMLNRCLRNKFLHFLKHQVFEVDFTNVVDFTNAKIILSNSFANYITQVTLFKFASLVDTC